MVRLEEIFEAYFDCRKNKRGTASALEFETNYELNCIQLWRELNDRTYKPSRSIAFVVRRPRDREVFAANFRDRIVHHWIDGKLRPLLEEDFSPRTFNNRKGKGTLACVNQLESDIASLGGDCYVMKMDIKGFFMSISKSLLTSQITEYIEKRCTRDDQQDLVWATRAIINDHPELNCIMRSPPEYWGRLDKSKSLFHIDPDRGLPIGNLPSQLLANFILCAFDHVVTAVFKCYGRYVDDFYIADKDKEKLLSFVPIARGELEKIGLTLHPHKFYIQHCSKGVEMVGVVLKPGRRYTHNRTVHNAFQAVRRLGKIHRPESNVQKALATVNSYLGLMRHTTSFGVRRNLAESMPDSWSGCVGPKAGFNSLKDLNGNSPTAVAKKKIAHQQLTNKIKRNGHKSINQRQALSDSDSTRLSA